MANFKPSAPFSVPFLLLKPTVTKKQGVNAKTFETPESATFAFFGSFKTYGGTEREVNGVFTLDDTATVDTWFNPDITADARVYCQINGKTYEILGSPENIDLRNQYMRIKLQAIGGQP